MRKFEIGSGVYGVEVVGNNTYKVTTDYFMKGVVSEAIVDMDKHNDKVVESMKGSDLTITKEGFLVCLMNGEQFSKSEEEGVLAAAVANWYCLF